MTNGDACLGSLAAARLLIPDRATLRTEQKDGQVKICKFEADGMTSQITLDEAGLPVQVKGEADGFGATLTQLTVSYGQSQ